MGLEGYILDWQIPNLSEQLRLEAFRQRQLAYAYVRAIYRFSARIGMMALIVCLVGVLVGIRYAGPVKKIEPRWQYHQSYNRIVKRE